MKENTDKNQKIDDYLASVKLAFKKMAEEYPQRIRAEYENALKNPNNFSYWYPRVKDCGIQMATAQYFILPFEQFENMMFDHDKYKSDMFEEWFNANIIPSIINPRSVFNIKNGTFSNKFNFIDCVAYKIQEIPDKFRCICYNAQIVGAGGCTEIVIRNYIPFKESLIPTIYNGMPLRTEFRVFYDFNKHIVIHTHNYWDYEYCANNLYNKTDKIIFESMSFEIEKIFEHNKDKVGIMVDDAFLNNNKLTGIWSIDIMYVEEEDRFYLIDMALGHQSAYWSYCKEYVEMNYKER